MQRYTPPDHAHRWPSQRTRDRLGIIGAGLILLAVLLLALWSLYGCDEWTRSRGGYVPPAWYAVDDWIPLPACYVSKLRLDGAGVVFVLSSKPVTLDPETGRHTAGTVWPFYADPPWSDPHPALAYIPDTCRQYEGLGYDTWTEVPYAPSNAFGYLVMVHGVDLDRKRVRLSFSW